MTTTDARTTRPNVLVFFCDQLRPDIIGCYGGNMVRTPTWTRSPQTAPYSRTVYPYGHLLPCAGQPDDRAVCTQAPHVQQLDAAVLLLPASETRHEDGAGLGGRRDGLRDSVLRQVAHRAASGPVRHSLRARPQATLPRTQRRCSQRATGIRTRAFGPLVQSFAHGTAGTLDVPMDEFPDVQVAKYSTDFMRSRSGERPFLLYASLPGPHGPWMVPEEWGIRYDPRRSQTGPTGTTTSTASQSTRRSCGQSRSSACQRVRART